MTTRGPLARAARALRHPRRLLVAAAATLLLVLAACGGTAPSGSAPGKDAGAKPVTASDAGAKPGGDTIGGDAATGKQLFASKGCIACHVAPGVPGATGTIGPTLAGIGDPAKRPKLADGADNSPAHVKEWIQDPQKLKPGTMMPNLGLSDTDGTDLTAFLLTLK